jgi:nucleotide-binding universal stress UspA family protein
MKGNYSKSPKRRDVKSGSLADQAEPGSDAPGFLKVRSILVGVDFSDFSLRALRYAVGLTAELNASLTVVPADYGLLNIGKEASRDLDEALQSQAAESLRRLAETEIGRAASANLEVRIGRPAEEIVAAALESKCDLIVLSTHGYSGIDHILIGSVAERVTRLAPCPILIVRGRTPPARQKQVRSIVLRFEHKTKHR